jgi:transcription elongation GreA/GreB family factor
VAHALHGSKAGDVAVVTTPGGKRRFKVVAVS